MSYRGRGRGRGGRGFGGGFELRFAKHEPYVLFPEDVKLPDLSYISSLNKEYVPLISHKMKLEHFWKGSCYHLEDSAPKSSISDVQLLLCCKREVGLGREEEALDGPTPLRHCSSLSQNTFIERYSDKDQQKNLGKREALQSYLRLIPSNFPPELIQGSKLIRHNPKKLRWDGDPDDKLFEKFEKLEDSDKVDEKGQERKEEIEEEEEDQLGEEDGENSDDGDYNQNIDFDDDEDDLNMEAEEYEDAYE